MRAVGNGFVILVVLAVAACGVSPTAAPATAVRPTSVPPTASAVAANSIDAVVNDYLRRLAGVGFRGAVLVAQGGEVVLAQGYGPQAGAGSPPLTADTLFNIGSVSKTFTAAAILKLRDQGKLNLDDSLSTYLPDAPSDKAAITLEQLLTHTAGLESAGIGQGDLDPIGRDAAVAEIMAKALLLPPGEQSAYSNLGYTLLAAIVETASGRGFEDYVRSELLAPAGMTSTGWWGADPATAGKPMAHGFDNGVDRGSGADLPPPGWAILGAGGMVSTVNDLYRWHAAVEAGRVLSPESRAAYSSGHFPVDDRTQEGYGWIIGQSAAGSPVRIVGGDSPEVAHTAAMAWDMGEDLVVIVTASNWAYQAGVVQRPVRRLALGQDVLQPPDVVEPDQAALEALAGEYVLVEGGGLAVTPSALGLRVAALDEAAFAQLFPAEVLAENGDPLDLDAHHANVLAFLAGAHDSQAEAWQQQQAQTLGAFTGFRVLGTAPLPGGAEPWTYVYFDFEGGSRLTRWVISPHGALQAADLAAEPPAVEVFPAAANAFVAFTLGVPARLERVTFDAAALTGTTGDGATFVARRE